VRILFYLGIVLVGIWLWRSLTRPEKSGTDTPPASEPKPNEMVRCSQCGVHLPASEAVHGQRGVYCSQAHLTASEP